MPIQPQLPVRSRVHVVPGDKREKMAWKKGLASHDGTVATWDTGDGYTGDEGIAVRCVG